MNVKFKHLFVCTIAVFSAQSSANAPQVGIPRMSMGLEASTVEFSDATNKKFLPDFWIQTLGLTFGREFGLNSIVSLKPNFSVGTEIPSKFKTFEDRGAYYIIDTTVYLYGKIALDTYFYVPQVEGLHFFVAPTYSAYHKKIYAYIDTDHPEYYGDRREPSYGDGDGFGFHIGLGYQFNNKCEIRFNFEKDYHDNQLSTQSFVLGINYLF